MNYYSNPTEKLSSVWIVATVTKGNGWILHIFGSYKCWKMSIDGKAQVGNINLRVKKKNRWCLRKMKAEGRRYVKTDSGACQCLDVGEERKI